MTWRKGHLFVVLVVFIAIIIFFNRFTQSSDKTPQQSTTPMLFLGVDGAAWKFIQPLLEQGALPNITDLIDKGTHGYLETLLPTQSVIIWNSIVTGCLPEKHGITGWLSGAGDQLAISSTMRRQPGLWDIASNRGFRGLYVNWWTTWPVTPVDGILLSHFLFYQSTPERVYPQSFSNEVDDIITRERKRFSDRRSTGTNDGRHDIRMSTQAENDDILVTLTEKFCHQSRFDIVALYLRGPDIIEHEYYQDYFPEEFDPAAITDVDRASWIPDYYRLVDEWIGRLRRLFADQVNVVIMSDHGMEALTEKDPPIATLVFNRLLADMGYAIIWDEYSLDWEKTIVFQYDYHMPGVLRRARLNLIGRDKQGTIPSSDFISQRQEICERLRSLVVERAINLTKVPLFTKIELTDGEESDFSCELNTDIMPNDKLIFDDKKIVIDKYLTHFLSHTSGQHDHAPPGIIICSGPAFREGVTLTGARVIDVLPTISAINGWPLAETWDGTVLYDALVPELSRGDLSRISAYPMPVLVGSGPNPKENRRPSKEVEDDVRKNLRSLGYIQ